MVGPVPTSIRMSPPMPPAGGSVFQVWGADTWLHASCGGWRCWALPSPQGDSQGTRPCLGQYLDCVRGLALTPGAREGERGGWGHRLAHTRFPCRLKGCYWSPVRTSRALSDWLLGTSWFIGKSSDSGFKAMVRVTPQAPPPTSLLQGQSF